MDSVGSTVSTGTTWDRPGFAAAYNACERESRCRACSAVPMLARVDEVMRRAAATMRFAPSIVIANVAQVTHTDTHVSTMEFLHATGTP